MTNPLAPQVAVVAALLGRFALTNAPELQFARDQLAQAVRLAQTNTAAYNIPPDQQFPDGVGFETIAIYVNPLNTAGALLTLVNAAQRAGFALTVDADLQVYNAGAWQLLAGTLLPPIPVNLTATAVQAAPPAPPPAAPPAAPPPAPAAAPAQDLSGLVQSVLAEPPRPDPVVAPSTVAANPTVATPAVAPTAPQGFTPPTAEQLSELFPDGVQSVEDMNLFTGLRTGKVSYDQAVADRAAAAPAQQAQQATLPPPTPVSPPQAGAPALAAAGGSDPTASAPANHGRPADGERLPDSSVLAQRTGQSGRPQKSPFEGKIAERKAVAAAPFWWDHFRYSAKHILAVNPAQALDPSSTGAAPVQAYAMLLTLLQDVMKPLDPNTTAAEIRTFLREVETGMTGLESAAAVFQLSELYFSAPTTPVE